LRLHATCPSVALRRAHLDRCAHLEKLVPFHFLSTSRPSLEIAGSTRLAAPRGGVDALVRRPKGFLWLMRPSSVIVLCFAFLSSVLQPLTACVPARHASDVAGVPTAGGPWHTTSLVDHPLVGHILYTRTGEIVPRDALEQTVRQKSFVLLGEKHDN